MHCRLWAPLPNTSLQPNTACQRSLIGPTHHRIPSYPLASLPPTPPPSDHQLPGAVGQAAGCQGGRAGAAPPHLPRLPGGQQQRSAGGNRRGCRGAAQRQCGLLAGRAQHSRRPGAKCALLHGMHEGVCLGLNKLRTPAPTPAAAAAAAGRGAPGARPRPLPAAPALRARAQPAGGGHAHLHPGGARAAGGAAGEPCTREGGSGIQLVCCGPQWDLALAGTHWRSAIPATCSLHHSALTPAYS